MSAGPVSARIWRLWEGPRVLRGEGTAGWGHQGLGRQDMVFNYVVTRQTATPTRMCKELGGGSSPTTSGVINLNPDRCPRPTEWRARPRPFCTVTCF